MKTIAHTLIVFGVAILLVLGGMVIQKEIYKRAPRRVEVKIVERPVEIPSSETTVDFVPVAPDTTRQSYEDSLFALAALRGERDSLAREALKVREATVMDTIAVQDSLGSFYTRAIHYLTYDGATNILTKITTYEDAKLKTVNTDTEVVLQPSLWEIIKSPYVWLVAAITFLAGVIA